MGTVSNEKLAEVFSELIDVAIKGRDLSLSPSAEKYVVAVISDLSSAPHQLASQSVVIVDLLRKGLNSDGYIRSSYLRVAGDVALFVSGIFPDSLESRRVCFTLGDYIDIGQQAYKHIQTEVFDELALKFPEVVDVLNTVSEKIDLLSRDLQRYIKRRRTIDAFTRR